MQRRASLPGQAIVLLLASLWCGFFISARVLAQNQPPPPAQPTPVGEAAAATHDRVIYVPYAEFEKVFGDSQADVLLPYGEYRKMLEAWRAAQATPQPPDAVITSVRYVATVEEDLAKIQAIFTVNVAGKAWSAVPVRFGSAAVGAVTSDTQVLMRGTGEGAYELIFAESGTQEVTIDLAARIHQSPEGREFEFASPHVAQTELDVTVPEANQTIVIQPAGTRVSGGEAQMGETHVRTNLGSVGELKIRWHPEASRKPEMNLLTSVTNRQLVTVSEGLIHTDAWLTYDILRGETSELRIALPKSARLLDIASAGRIRRWTANEDGERQVVTVELLNPATDALTLEVHAELPLEESETDLAGMAPDGDAPVHGIHALDAVRESGQIAVRHSSDLSVAVVEQQGVVRVDPSDVDEHLKGANAFVYRFYAPNLVLRVAVHPVEPRVQIGHQARFLFQDEELRFQNTLDYGIERAGIFELRYKLPDGVQIDEVRCAAMKEYAVNAMANELVISLKERTQGSLQAVVHGHLPLSDEAGKSFTLPLIEPVDVDRETGTILVYAKESVEVQTDLDGLTGVQPSPVSAQRQFQGAVLTSAWSFSHRPVTVPVTIVQKPTRLTAQVGTTIDVQTELVRVHSRVRFQVEYSGIDTFRISVPEAISGQVRIEVPAEEKNSAAIKQKTAAEPVDGRVVWTVVTQRDVIGTQQLDVIYDVPLPVVEDGQSAPREISLNLVAPLGLVDANGNETTPLTRIQGEVLLQKDRSLSLSAEATGGGIEPIDVRELTLLPGDGTLAYRYFRADEAPVQVTVTSRRFDIQEVVSTLVLRSLCEIVISEDEAATYRCRMQVKSSERQRLQVLLPANLEILGTFVNDREVKLEQVDAETTSDNDSLTPFWINITRPESSDVPFLLTFQFLWKVNPSLAASESLRGTLELPLPVIGEQAGPTQVMKVIVLMPDDYVLVGDAGAFRVQRSWRPLSALFGTPAAHGTGWLDSWVTEGLTANPGIAELPTEDRTAYIYTSLGGNDRITIRWWHRLGMTLLFSIALGLIGLVLVRTSWENKLGVLLLLAFAAALFGLRDSQALSATLHAARFGLALMIGLWIVHALFGRNRPQQRTRRSRYTPHDVPYAVVPPPGVFEHLNPSSSETTP